MKKIAFLLLCMPNIYAQAEFKGFEHLFTEPLQYSAFKTTDKIIVDGKSTEADWNKIAWSENFGDIEGSKKPAPRQNTRFKMLWDTDHVYILAEIEEEHVWAYLEKHDEIVFYDNDFEVFIDPDGDTFNYFEIEVNARNTIFDLFLPEAYRNGRQPIQNWDVQNMKTAVSIDGTINNPNDKDKKWTVEMAIPFSALSLGNKVDRPVDKQLWRINFSRVEWTTEVVNNKYVKKQDPKTKKPLPEDNWVWSPQGVINMHLPERWGYLQFRDEKPVVENKKFALPISEQMKKYLVLLYYKQQGYREKNKHYASKPTEVGMQESFLIGDKNCKLTIDACKKQYNAIAHIVETDEKWQINQNSEIVRVIEIF